MDYILLHKSYIKDVMLEQSWDHLAEKVIVQVTLSLILLLEIAMPPMIGRKQKLS